MISGKIQQKVLARAQILYDVPNSRKRHFSFIMAGQKIICTGVNDGWKTHPLAKKYGYRFHSTHSELSAISHFAYPVRELNRYKFINVRLMADRTVGLAKPCRLCQVMLQAFGVDQVYYTNREGDFESLLLT